MTRSVRVWCVAAVALVPLVLAARVFETRGGGVGDPFVPSSLGTQIYHARMQVNRGLAEVCVVACEEGLESICKAFRRVGSQGQAVFSAGESLHLGIARRSGEETRAVMLETAGQNGILVSVGQSISEATASRSMPSRHMLEDVPAPGEAVVTSFSRNQDTRTALECLTSRLSRESLAEFYEGEMGGRGWRRLYRTAARTGLSLYVRNEDLCWVRIGDTDSDGATRITLLHKPGAVR